MVSMIILDHTSFKIFYVRIVNLLCDWLNYWCFIAIVSHFLNNSSIWLSPWPQIGRLEFSDYMLSAEIYIIKYRVWQGLSVLIYDLLLSWSVAKLSVGNTSHETRGISSLWLCKPADQINGNGAAGHTTMETPVASFTKEVNTWLAKRPLVFNGRLTYRGLTSLVEEATDPYADMLTLFNLQSSRCDERWTMACKGWSGTSFAEKSYWVTCKRRQNVGKSMQVSCRNRQGTFVLKMIWI